jgi:hypothetical protein
VTLLMAGSCLPILGAVLIAPVLPKMQDHFASTPGAKAWDDELLQAYHDRRIPRVRTVVEASVQLGQWQLDGVRDADMAGLVGRTMNALKERP